MSAPDLSRRPASVSSSPGRHPSDSAIQFREWHFRPYLTIWLWCVVLAVLTHCSMLFSVLHQPVADGKGTSPVLFRAHQEGDELVYYVLAQRMGWDLSNYTTRDDPRVRNFPYTIYQKPLFHHPPLYPYLLKIGLAWGSNPLLEIPYVPTPKPERGKLSPIVEGGAVAMAYLLSIALTSAGAFYVWRLMSLAGIEPAYGAAGMFALTLCPLVLFSTVRIHHDGLAGLALFCGTVAFAEALARGKTAVALEAAFWLVVAFNLRFNSIMALPVLAALPVYAWTGMSRKFYVEGTATTAGERGGGDSQSISVPGETAPTDRRQVVRVTAIVFGLLMTLGMQHYYRLFATYGTISPGVMIQPTPDAIARSPFLRLVENKITRGWVLSELAMLFPLAFLFGCPTFVRRFWRDLRERRWIAGFVVILAALFALQLLFSYKQLRYFAIVSVFLHASWPYLLKTLLAERVRWNVIGLGVLTFLLMTTTGFLNSNVQVSDQALLQPSGVFYWPAMLPQYVPGD